MLVLLEEIAWTCACGQPMGTTFGYNNSIKTLTCVKCGPVATISVKLSKPKAKKITTCKDCGAETKPGKGSARCPGCWEDRCGHE